MHTYIQHQNQQVNRRHIKITYLLTARSMHEAVKAVTHPHTNQARCTVTAMTETNLLRLSQTAQQTWPPAIWLPYISLANINESGREVDNKLFPPHSILTIVFQENLTQLVPRSCLPPSVQAQNLKSRVSSGSSNKQCQRTKGNTSRESLLPGQSTDALKSLQPTDTVPGGITCYQWKLVSKVKCLFV